MINFLVGKYIIYQPGQYSRPQVTPSLSNNIELRNCPSWNIAHIPRAGAASGLHRPSGCERYFIRDNSFVRYLEITSVIKAFGPSGPHALITGCYFCYHTVINHSGLMALVVDNSVITGITMVITFGLSYHLVDIQYYYVRLQDIMLLKKSILVSKKLIFLNSFQTMMKTQFSKNNLKNWVFSKKGNKGIKIQIFWKNNLISDLKWA